MKRILALLLFALATATISFAQSNFQDVIYLKDGSVVRGTIIDKVPNKSVQIKMADKTVFIYQMDQIDKLAREPYRFKSDRPLSQRGLQFGYKGLVDVGYQVGQGEYGLNRLSFNVVNSLQANPYFSIGLGAGLRYYMEPQALLMPIFLDLRANVLDEWLSPYLAVSVGLTLDATQNFSDVGLLFCPVLGVTAKIADKSALHLGVGYEMQRVVVRSGGYYLYESFVTSGAICVNVGV